MFFDKKKEQIPKLEVLAYVQVMEQDMQDTYEPPFRSCIQQGKASCLMCSYNSVNGIPACAHKDLLQKARTDWGFEGWSYFFQLQIFNKYFKKKNKMFFNFDLMMKTYMWSANGHNYRYIASDCDAVATIYEYHNYTKSPEDAVAIALKAGIFF